MEREAIHLSHADAVRNIAAILEQVQQGAEIVVEKENRPVAVIQPVKRPGRLLSDCIALAELHSSTVTLDDEFGKDLEEIIASHQEPLDASQWD